MICKSIRWNPLEYPYPLAALWIIVQLNAFTDQMFNLTNLVWSSLDRQNSRRGPIFALMPNSVLSPFNSILTCLLITSVSFLLCLSRGFICRIPQRCPDKNFSIWCPNERIPPIILSPLLLLLHLFGCVGAQEAGRLLSELAEQVFQLKLYFIHMQQTPLFAPDSQTRSFIDDQRT